VKDKDYNKVFSNKKEHFELIKESLIALKEFNKKIILEASKKNILIDKLGFNEQSAEMLDKVAGSLSVIIANKIIDFQLQALTQGRNTDYTRKNAVDALNSGNLKNLLSRITEVMDWVRVGLNGKLGEYQNLGFKELIYKSKEWHNSLGVSSGQINYEEKNPILIDFRKKNGEGFYWVDLQTNNSTEECERMGHCGRTGSGNNLYSLREVKKLPGGKYTINKSHLTASIGNDGTLYQLKGPKNSKPKDEYHNLILPLFYYETDDDFLINDFGTEYAAERDFKVTDLPNEVIINLYENRPELFESRKLKLKLAKLGIIKGPEINFNVKIKTNPDRLQDIVSGDYVISRRKVVKTTPAGNKYEQKVETWLFETILSGDAWELWQNYDVDWKSSLNYNVNSENEKKIEELLKIMAIKNNPDFNEEEFNDMSLQDKIEEYDDDHEIRSAISNATSNAESSDYVNHLYEELKSALEELGPVEKMNDEEVIFTINMEDYIDNLDSYWYDEYMDRCDDNLECVFFEMIGNDIDKPKFDVDDRWYPDIDETYFNEMLSDYLSDVERTVKK
jgi:hypothetical protein